MEKNKNEINIKKIVLEIIVIPLAIMYLYYSFLHNHPKINLVFLYITALITCIEFIIKYIHEVYVYENKYNFLRILYVVISFLIIIFMFLNIVLKYKIIQTVLIILLIIMLCHSLWFAIININRILKSKGTLYINTFSAFFSLISFTVILAGIIIFL